MKAIGVFLMAALMALTILPLTQEESSAAAFNIPLNKTPGNTTRVTGTLKAGVTKELSFTTTDRESYYKIEIVNSEGDGYIKALLLDEDKVLLEEKTFIRQGNKKRFSYLIDKERKLTRNSMHYISMQSNSTSNPIDYVILLTEYPDDMGNTKSEAKSITTGKTKGALEIDDIGDTDWMVFKAPAKGTYHLTLRNASVPGNNLNWCFYDRDGVLINQRSFHNQDEVSTRDFQLAKGENLFVRAKGAGYGEYSITIQQPNPMTVKVFDKKVSRKKVKSNKVALKPIVTANAQGKVSYAKAGGSKRLSVNKTTGKITVKKGTAKGTYKIKVAVKAGGNSKFCSKTVTKTIKIKVK
ncbi:MAG: hypothetical protein IJ109_02250 [Firmicutes bacterium]|nr:hypothetical protein [Bacillota bacterium]